LGAGFACGAAAVSGEFFPFVVAPVVDAV
jgi:hypothetical protein